jgi:hypothetical protein
MVITIYTILKINFHNMSQDSSVIEMAEWRLDDRGSIPGRGNHFRIDSWIHAASYLVGTTGGRRQELDADSCFTSSFED